MKTARKKTGKRPAKRERVPSFSLTDPPDWVFDGEYIGDDESLAGVHVSKRSALGYAAVWRAVNLISNMVGKLPLHVLRRDDTDDSKARDKMHPAYMLLRLRPNETMSAFTFRQVLTHHVLLYGNGYAYIERSGNGDPISLTPLDACQVSVARVNGKVVYTLRNKAGNTGLRADEVLHIKGLGNDGLCGYSVLGLARKSWALGLAAREYTTRFYTSGGSQRAVLEHPSKLTPEARNKLKSSWAEAYGGIANAHKVAVLEEGMKLNTYGIPAKDAQLLESRQFETREVAAWFGVPPHKLGDATRTAYASLEAENQSLLDDCIDPWLVMWEEAAMLALLREEEIANDTHIIEFQRNAFVRADIAARYTAYNIGRSTGSLSANDIRRLENQPSIGPQGDVYLVPLNMRPATELVGDDAFKRDVAKSIVGASDVLDESSLLAEVGLPVNEPDEMLPVDVGASPGGGADSTSEDDQANDGSSGDSAGRSIAAHRQLVSGVLRRIIRRVRKSAERIAETEGRDALRGWAKRGAIELNHGRVARECLADALDSLRSIRRNDAADLGHRIWERLKARMESDLACGPDQNPTALMEQWERLAAV